MVLRSLMVDQWAMPCPPRTSPPRRCSSWTCRAFVVVGGPPSGRWVGAASALIAAGAPLLRERFDWVYAECSFQELYARQSFADEVIAWLRERGLRLAARLPHGP